MALPATQAGSGSIAASISRRYASPALLCLVLILSLSAFAAQASNEAPSFREVPTQYIAALGDPNARSGYGAQTWRLWRRDPGPRGVWLRNFERQLVDSGGVAPANWNFDSSDWWLDENGLIMEEPKDRVAPGRYIVTGDREAMAVLTVYPMDDMGRQRWELGNDATLYDVTHLPCRSARYTPLNGGDCSPASANRADFPVTPGAEMPAVSGCRKQDYAVLFIIAEEVRD